MQRVAKEATIMTNQKTKFDYSKVESKEDLRYWGLHPKKGRLYIDTKRYKKICEIERFTEFIPSGLFQNRNTHYFIPNKQKRHDYKYNLFRDLILQLKEDWFCEYKNVFAAIKTPEEAYQNLRLDMIAHSSGSDDLDEIEFDAMIHSFNRIKKYNEIINSLYFQFIQKITSEITRYMLLVCNDLGYKSNDFSIDAFFKFSDGLIKDKSQPKINKFRKYNAFNLLNKINNFLKHNTLRSYEQLKKHYPKNVRTKGVDGCKIDYENGMYAGDWIIIKPDYIDKLFDKLIIFFEDYCSIILKENIKEADWNYDDYFRDAFKVFQFPNAYYGIR